MATLARRLEGLEGPFAVIGRARVSKDKLIRIKTSNTHGLSYYGRTGEVILPYGGVCYNLSPWYALSIIRTSIRYTIRTWRNPEHGRFLEDLQHQQKMKQPMRATRKIMPFSS